MSGTRLGRNKQHGFRPEVAPTLLEEDLLSMKKAELVSLAGDLGIALEPKATKSVIVDAILAG